MSVVNSVGNGAMQIFGCDAALALVRNNVLNNTASSVTRVHSRHIFGVAGRLLKKRSNRQMRTEASAYAVLPFSSRFSNRHSPTYDEKRVAAYCRQKAFEAAQMKCPKSQGLHLHYRFGMQ